MSKQTHTLRRTCQHRNCVRDAIIGVYAWGLGQTDVNLDKPVLVTCGEHKLKLDYGRGQTLRNIRLLR